MEGQAPGDDETAGAMTTSRLAELMRAADTAWTTAEGVTRHWRRQDLVDLAFQRHFEQLRAHAPAGSVALVAAVADDPDAADDTTDEVVETVLAVAADRPLRRRRAELLAARGAELRADLLVNDGDTFWARTGDEVLTNGGNPNHGHGGAEIIDQLLCPSYVPALFSLTSHGTTQLAGRTCVEVTARPRVAVSEEEQWDWPGKPFAMITGGDEFRLAVDASTGVIVRASKFVDGELAEITEWQELHLDPVLPASLFAPVH
jgi:hypothetical protein